MNKFHICILLFALFASCANQHEPSGTYDLLPLIVPDYADVTVPPNVAPLNFSVPEITKGYVSFESENYSFVVGIRKGDLFVPKRKWKKILGENRGKDISVSVISKEGGRYISYRPFTISISLEEIDPFVVYRRIDPGYELWNKMGIYEREIESYKERPLYENKMTGMNCVNCHSFAQYNPDIMSFHMRSSFSGTYILKGNNIEKLLIDNNEAGVPSLVYPSWHPEGRFVAYSSNVTRQGFHTSDPNRIEVFDNASDIVIYDSKNHVINKSSLLFSENSFETFPSFAPDGKSLYFCSAPAVKMPDYFDSVRYNILRVSFDPENGTIGKKIDTVFNCMDTCSASFPRVSPDGNYLLFTVTDYGNFSIWHREADLKMVDLRTGQFVDTDPWNSEETESYHSWSSNGRWVVFSSRRGSTLFTRLYFGYIDSEGNVKKPFLMPQKNTGYYDYLLQSYNIPEFITARSKMSSFRVSRVAKSDKTIKVSQGLNEGF